MQRCRRAVFNKQHEQRRQNVRNHGNDKRYRKKDRNTKHRKYAEQQYAEHGKQFVEKRRKYAEQQLSEYERQFIPKHCIA